MASLMSTSYRSFSLAVTVMLLGTPLAALAQQPHAVEAADDSSVPDVISADLAAKFRDATRLSVLSAQRSEVEFANPPEIRSGAGKLKATLWAEYAHTFIGDDAVFLRSYNGALVGPTLRARPGDNLLVRVINDLPDESPTAHPSSTNGPHNLNTTNLHSHGLHVSPEDNSDNVFLEVAPRSRQDFRFSLPQNHPPGTHWYHPHKHGSVAIQVSSGMAGALIIEGGLDDIKEIKEAKDRIFVFQQIPYSEISAAEPVGKLELEHFDRIRFWSSLEGRQTTINGFKQPVIEMAPGEVERWRFIHAGIAEQLDIALQTANQTKSLKLNAIAADGIALGTIQPMDFVTLAPGYRWDVLVQAPTTPGEYFVFDLQTSPGRPSLRLGEIETTSALARVVVCGTPKNMPLPDAAALAHLAPYKKITSVQNKRRLEFDGAGSVWKINGQQFDPTRTDHCPVVGTAEEWELFSKTEHHPFHIHVNPFEIISVKNPDEKEVPIDAVWKDTVLLRSGHTITLRMRFEDFAGKTVLHCHKLDHEDQGMMQMFRILPACPTPPPSQGETVKNHRAPGWRLPDSSGQTHDLKQYAGRRLILVFHQGLDCLHCAEQLQAFAKRQREISDANLELVTIGPVTTSALRTALDAYTQTDEMPFLILADADHDVFKKYGCYDVAPLHGVFIIDERGEIRWQTIGDTAFMDVDTVLHIARNVRADETDAP
jgi:FtsP/CotA-like multicopper oxidase with cupredoxin domain/peroxiredoxin